MFLISRILLGAICVVGLGSAHSQMAQKTAIRALPLNRLADSRLAEIDGNGFYKMPTGIGDDYFDGTDSLARVRRHMSVARGLGVRYLRCAFSWNAIEKKQDKFNWRFWDHLVAEAERAGITLIPYIAYTPEWAARSQVEFWKQPPRSPALFAAFVQTIVARYRGRIRSWELWNEPDLSEYWKGTPEEFGELIRWGAFAARRADPDIVIVSGGLSLGPTEFFETLVHGEHILGYVDVLAQHGYPESWDPERAERVYLSWTKTMAAEIQSSGSGVDFWLNEIGYPDYRYTPTNISKYAKTDAIYDYEHTKKYQAVFLFKSFAMASASRASLTSWYRIDDFPPEESRLGDDLIHFHLGVVDASGRPKPDYEAFRFYNRLFSIPVRLVRSPDAQDNRGVVIEVFQRADGKVIVTGWLRSSERAEVADTSGMAHDNRATNESVALPCRDVPSVEYFDALGTQVQRSVQLQAFGAGTMMTGIELRGDDVFIALAECKN